MRTIIILSLFMSFNAYANCCICQTDTSPEEHIKWYKTGCRMWLTARGCPAGKVIPQTESIAKHIPKSCEGKKLKLGYVGHWASARDTVNYVSSLLKVLEEKDLSLYYDNTACLAMDRPELVQNYLNKISPELGDREIKIKGNQAISTGMWDPILPGKHNFKAYASTETEMVEYPKCKEFVDKSCWKMFQEGETGLCLEEDGTKSVLKCTADAEVEYTSSKRSAAGKVRKVVKKTKKMTAWKRVPLKAEDFKLSEGKDEVVYEVFFPSAEKSLRAYSKIGFRTPEERDLYVENIKQKLSSVTQKDYQNMKFAMETDKWHDNWVKNEEGEYVPDEKSAIITYYVSYQDPIIGRGIGREFKTMEEVEAFKREIQNTDLERHKKDYQSFSSQDRSYEDLSYVRNKEIGFSKRFNTKKEAHEYMAKLKKSSKKELREKFYDYYTKY